MNLSVLNFGYEMDVDVVRANCSYICRLPLPLCVCVCAVGVAVRCCCIERHRRRHRTKIIELKNGTGERGKKNFRNLDAMIVGCAAYACVFGTATTTMDAHRKSFHLFLEMQAQLNSILWIDRASTRQRDLCARFKRIWRAEEPNFKHEKQ